MIERLVAPAATVLTAVALAPAGVSAVAPAAAALGLFPLAVSWRSRTVGLVGATLLLAGVVVAGALELSPPLLVVATLGTVLAWDGTAQAIDLRAQVDDGETTRAAATHTGTTFTVTALLGATVSLVFLFAGTVPSLAIVLALAGAALLALGLGP